MYAVIIYAYKKARYGFVVSWFRGRRGFVADAADAADAADVVL